MPEIKIKLSDQEYSDAMHLCALTGKPQTYESLCEVLREVAVKGVIRVNTPIGAMDAWVDDGDDDEDIDIGIGFVPKDGDGSFVDFAFSRYDADEKKIVTYVFKDIMTEMPTERFSFGAKDIERAFPKEEKENDND